jgi:hypothetical protein
MLLLLLPLMVPDAAAAAWWVDAGPFCCYCCIISVREAAAAAAVCHGVRHLLLHPTKDGAQSSLDLKARQRHGQTAGQFSESFQCTRGGAGFKSVTTTVVSPSRRE